MKVLIACEYSGRVRDAFIKRGHDAISCDLLPTDIPGPHIQGDVIPLLKQPWDLVIAHPPCFATGTMVLTSNGYTAIEDVKVGDMVVTHLGRLRAVKEVMSRNVKSTVTVKSTNSLNTITTSEHPYYTRERLPYKNRFRTKHERDMEPEWTGAGSLTSRHFTASVLPDVIDTDVSIEDLWLMGRYVADGHMRESRCTEGKYEEAVISVGPKKVGEFQSSVIRKFSLSRADTCFKATFYGDDFIRVFEQFGRGCENKEIPMWVMQLPLEKASSFLRGYLSGDGYRHLKRLEASTVSIKLALGIALLMQRVYGKCPALGHVKERTGGINGRFFKTVAPQYKISTPISSSRLRNYVDGKYAWGHVRSVVEATGDTVVYNLSVEEDETYTANGVVVHNCTRLCNSGVRWLAERDLWQEMREGAEFFLACLNANAPLVAVENPVMHRYARDIIGEGPAFTVQPWQFGDDFKKRTCFWTRGLPALRPTSTLDGSTARADVHLASPGPDRWKKRSTTYQGIADAIAEQWGNNASK